MIVKEANEAEIVNVTDSTRWKLPAVDKIHNLWFINSEYNTKFSCKDHHKIILNENIIAGGRKNFMMPI